MAGQVVDNRVRLRKRFKLAVTMVTAGLSLLVGLALYAAEKRAERSLSLYDRQTIERLDAKFELRPYVMFGFNPFDRDSAEISPVFGFRPWPERVDAVVLGGSTAAGLGLERDQFEDAYFNVAARESGLRIVSAGYPAFVSAQDFLNLSLRILPRLPPPRAVAILSGLNDLTPFLNGQPPGYPLNWAYLWYLLNPRHAPVIALHRSCPSWDLLTAKMLRDAREQFLPDNTNLGHLKLQPVPVEAVLTAWETSIVATAALCRGARIPLMYIAQPNGGIIENPEYQLPSWSFNRQFHQFNIETWPAFLEHAQEVCAREGIYFVDATYAVAPDHFLDPAHLTVEGNNELGKFLAPHFARLLDENK